MDSATPASSPPAVKGLTRAEKIGKVAEWLVAGLRTSQLAEEWRRTGWGELGPLDVLELIDEAHEIIKADARVRADVEDAKAIARYNDLYARSLEIQDHKTCLRVQAALGQVLARLNNPMLRQAEEEAPE